MKRNATLLTALTALGTLVLALGADAAIRNYVGSEKCGSCHEKEYASWRATRMAKAFELLKPGVAADRKRRHRLDPTKDYTRDPECLSCHTTGYRKPGGFVDEASTPGLAGVGCEVCHGPGEEYTRRMASEGGRELSPAEKVAAGLVVEVSRERCLGCHNPKSPTVSRVGARQFMKDFQFEEQVAKGVHARRARSGG